MKRFLMLVGVAVVAAAMYVAASPASQQSKGPTEKQFLALQKKVTKLTAELNKTVKPEADLGASYILLCLASVNGTTVTVHQMPVLQRSGYQFGATTTTALDVAPAGTTPTAVLQEFDPSCLSGALRHSAVHLARSR